MKISKNIFFFKKDKIILIKQSDEDTNFDYVVEDMSVMNDFELHELCPFYEGLEGYRLTNKEILASAKFDMMNDLLEEIKQAVGICSFIPSNLEVN